MMRKKVVQDQIIERGLIGILRGIDETDIIPVASALQKSGVTIIEITADVKRCSEMIATVDSELTNSDTIVGAGTVMDAAAARNVIEAGAQFILAPNLNEEVIDICNREGIVVIPGVMTPTEAARAMEAGADILKLFPAATVGPGHISALQGPLGDVPIMPTGGVTPDSVADYFDAGAVAVGAGSALVDYEAIDAGDMDRVRNHAAKFVAAVEKARID